MLTSLKFVSSMVIVAATAIIVAAYAQPTGAAERPNLATRDAQQKLFEGIAPVKPRMRLRRTLNAPRPAEPFELPPASVDASNTAEARAGRAELDKIERNVAPSGWPKEAARGTERVVFASNDGKEYELEYDTATLAAMARKAMTRGVNHASDQAQQRRGDAEEAWPLILAAWSDGVDNRIKKPIGNTFPVNDRVLRRVGELNGGGCSGALIGRRLVLTAAHCIVRKNLSYNTHNFRARRSGAQMPYGTETTVGYWYATKWVSNNCHVNRVWDPCSQHDWAVLLLRDNAYDGSPNGHPGYMGYWIYGQNFIAANAVSHNDGYPGCSFQSAPGGCAADPNQIWGQTSGCPPTGFKWPHDNVPAYYRISCDISGGHSGSPNWTDYPGSNGPYAIGIAMWEHCFPCNANESADIKSHPSGFRGMTPYLASFITSQRQAYP